MRILVVEDEEQIGDFIKSGLIEHCHGVDLVQDGEKASFLARTTEYDLVILDNILPKKSGLEICQELRSKGRIFPILILSVKSETASKVELLSAGADDYLCKPFSMEELIARINALARRPRKIESEILTLDDLEVRVSSYGVLRDGKNLYLTRKEFMLLSYLLRHKGLVVSRGMILEHVWDMDGDPFSNTIESHISSLRRKIDTPGSRKLIHTIPGRGYKADLSKL